MLLPLDIGTLKFMTIISSPLIWILADDRAGNVSQVVGVANALGLPYVQKNIRYTRLGRLPNFVRGSSLLGIDLKNSSELKAPWPTLVISAGRKTAPIAKYIKRHSKGETKLVHLMHPGFPFNNFDMIALPAHDRKANCLSNVNIVKTVGAPHKVTKETLHNALEKWLPHFAHLPSPKIAVLIGGNTKKGIFTDAMATEFGTTLSNAVNRINGSLLITTSRRTSSTAAACLKNALTVPHFFYDPSSSLENPYFGLLSNADLIVVSGDSISMCSEACSTGKPVYIYAPESLIPTKHQAFHRELYRQHYARPFEHSLEVFECKTLHDTEILAQSIKDKFNL